MSAEEIVFAAIGVNLLYAGFIIYQLYQKDKFIAHLKGTVRGLASGRLTATVERDGTVNITEN